MFCLLTYTNKNEKVKTKSFFLLRFATTKRNNEILFHLSLYTKEKQKQNTKFLFPFTVAKQKTKKAVAL